MPRLTATRPTVSRHAPRPRVKKAASQQDRLKARTLFFRRVKRSLKPGLWLLGGICVIALGAEAFRALPPAGPVISPAVTPPGGSIRHGFGAFAAAFGFRVGTIEIHGADTTPLPVIQTALGVSKGDPILGFSLSLAESRIEQLGPVQTAVIQRMLPDTLVVTISERAPYAIWQTSAATSSRKNAAPSTKFVLIDKSGNVIANQDAAAAKRRNPALLLLAGQDAPQNASTLINELGANTEIMSRVIAAERVDGLRWNLILKNQTVVKLPVENESLALGQLGQLQASMALLDRPVESIDLRLPGRMIVHPYPPQSVTTMGHT
jgi:cell division protein FtsQ